MRNKQMLRIILKLRVTLNERENVYQIREEQYYPD